MRLACLVWVLGLLVACVPVDPCADGGCATDPCAMSPCSGLSRSRCVADSERFTCTCPERFVEIAETCVPASPCAPNPCVAPNQTTCVVELEAARCVCNPGFLPEGAGCSAQPVWDCAHQHASGDTSEPDECPALASPLVVGTSEVRSLRPAGDHDWFRVGVTPRHVYQVRATSLSLALVVEVFDEEGLRPIAVNRDGESTVTFFASASVVMLRVRALQESGTGGYTIGVVELGIDDWPETLAEAAVRAAPTTVSGFVQYPGDVDVVRLSVPAQVAIEVVVTAEAVEIELARAGVGSRRLQNGQHTTLTLDVAEELELRARAVTPMNTGSFSVAVSMRGADDHSDDAQFTRPRPLPLTTRVALDGGDVDFLRVEQATDHLYSWSGCGGLLRTVFDALDGPIATSEGAEALVWRAADASIATLRFALLDPAADLVCQVQLDDLGFDDHGDSLTAATVLSAAVASGRLELLSDVDAFSFVAVAGHVMRVTTSPPGLALELYDATGAKVAEGQGVVAAPASRSEPFVALVRRGGAGPGVVPYSLTVADLGADDFQSGPAALIEGVPVSGDLQWPADVDAWTFNPLVGHIYTLNLTAPADAVGVRVLDGAGSVVLNSAQFRNFLVQSGGAWTVEISVYRSQTNFTLTLTDLGPDDHGDTPATATPLTLGQSISGSIGYGTDIDVFVLPVAQGNRYAVTSSTPLRMIATDATHWLGSSTMSQFEFRAATTSAWLRVESNFPVAYTLEVVDLGP